MRHIKVWDFYAVKSTKYTNASQCLPLLFVIIFSFVLFWPWFTRHVCVFIILLTQTALLYVIKTQNGMTPVHFASDKGHTDVVDVLVQAGADIHLATKVLHYSRQCSLQLKQFWRP